METGFLEEGKGTGVWGGRDRMDEMGRVGRGRAGKGKALHKISFNYHPRPTAALPTNIKA